MSTRAVLRIGVTPCPNDTFVVGGLATGLLALPDADVTLALQDIEALNEAALARLYDVVKVSCALYGELAPHYALLDVGAAIAEDYGPLILSREPMTREDLAHARVAAPGAHTTGTALAKLYAPAAGLRHVRYDEIVPGLRRGDFDAGVVIHESRLTFRGMGLHRLVDLGHWWRATTGLPVALGCYLIRRELHAAHARPLEALLRRSMALAAAGDAGVHAYIRCHAQEMGDQVLADYIALYVNARTRHLGPKGRAAILELGARLRAGVPA